MAAMVFMLVLALLAIGVLVVMHLKTSGVYGRSSEAADLAREQARIRQEARDASWEIHRRVSGALTEMMEAARDAQRRDQGRW
jgi:hypothetical protein